MRSVKTRRIAVLLIGVGTGLLLCAGMLLFTHLRRDRLAGQTSAALVGALKSGQCTVRTEPIPTAVDPAENEKSEDTTSSVSAEPIAFTADKLGLLGVLRIDALSVELPVLAEWSDALLDIAPCRYSGSIAQGNLVILGHSYDSHFRPLRQAEVGMSVLFTDAAGFIHRYTVAEVEIVSGTDGDRLPSAYPLTVFTCTADSRHRVLVRCAASD